MGQDEGTGSADDAGSSPASTPGEEDGGALFERLLRAREALERERAEAPGLLAALLRQPPHVQAERLERDPRFQTWGLADLLLTHGEALLADDPFEAGRLAQQALAVAERLVDRHPTPLVEDFRARSWAGVGEACLKAGDLAGAGAALSAAAACLAHGTGDLLVDARLLEFEAAVRAGEGRYGEAVALLKQAASRYRSVNEPDHLARVLEKGEALQREAPRPGSVPHFAFEPMG
jgi:tetratricopeptide (TPR) repeat protein